MKAPQSIFLTDTCIYTVELPISKHWRPEVKVAKKAEIKNLQDFIVLKILYRSER